MKHKTADSIAQEWEECYKKLEEWINPSIPEVSRVQRDQLKEYCEYLYYCAGKVNLIADGDRKDLATKHVLPSLGIANLLSCVPNTKVLDLGSGAGLPGIPLKIMFPESDFYLIESRRRRANFLRETVRRVGLKKIEVCNDRVEALRGSLRGEIDAVVSRATKKTTDLLDWVRPVLKSYGILIVTLDRARGLHKGEGFIFRGKSEWEERVNWYGGVR